MDFIDQADAGLGTSEEKRVPLQWDNFRNWLHCVCVVTFDLELGQALEFKYPDDAELSDKERSNICYLSFPDSNSGCMGDTQYCFRIRKNELSSDIGLMNGCTADFPAVLHPDDSHFYGYVYFRQVRDKTLKRGYFQKSVVLLSRLPYFNFFKEIVEIIAPEYFDHGETCLVTACQNIDSWAFPVPGQTLELPLLGTMVRVRIPSKSDKPGEISKLQTVQARDYQYTISTVHELDIIKYFHPVLLHCNLLWELVMLGEPLVVMSGSPEACANTVLSLTSCISPLRYSCDYRPYFTIHDSEFKEFTTRVQAPPRVLLGVTNPFFTKTLQNWPHIVHVGHISMPTSSSMSSLMSSDKLKKTNKIKTFDTKPGVYTEYKMFLKRDKSFFKSLAKPGHRFTSADSVALRRHFLELTQSFMIPLERYMASLMPLQKTISPLRAPPVLKSFRPDEFLATVETQGPQLTSGTKGNWTGLYKKFFQSPNFVSWLNSRRTEMERKIMALHLSGLSEMDLVSWSDDKSEVEKVDMILRLKGKLKSIEKHEVEIPDEKVKKLQNQFQLVIDTLPIDLRHVINVK